MNDSRNVSTNFNTVQHIQNYYEIIIFMLRPVKTCAISACILTSKYALQQKKLFIIKLINKLHDCYNAHVNSVYTQMT